ncbi:MAG: YceI family protein [bacterium]
MKRFISLAVTAVLAVGTLLAQDTAWKLDKSHTSVSFSVRHMIISDVTGSFKDFDVSMTSSKEDFSDLTVEAAIKVASITTDNQGRDNHLKSDDFFNAEKFPEIKFKSTKVEKVGDKSFKITGDFTMRDVTKQVTFDAVLNGVIITERGTVSGWKATTAINRFDYNLKWNRALETGGLVVGEMVNITLNLELQKPNNL